MSILSNLKWKKYHPLSDQNAFICLVDVMGDDSSIVQAARVSYGKDEKNSSSLRLKYWSERLGLDIISYDVIPGSRDVIITLSGGKRLLYKETDEDIQYWKEIGPKLGKASEEDRQLIRYLMNHSHTTPFEMVEFKFMVQVPMDCWRQWIRHRTANVNEYSTRYTEALDFFQVTQPTEWRLQATDNKQGSSGFLTEWTSELCTGGTKYGIPQIDSENWSRFVALYPTPGDYLSTQENWCTSAARNAYEERLHFGIAKEQARKDLPLSTYTRAYWKCDLHNIFNFLRLRLDSHAQLEIRSYANSMFEIITEVCPIACEAFVDYVLEARRFNAMEMEMLRELIHEKGQPSLFNYLEARRDDVLNGETASPLTNREWSDFLKKLS